MIRRTRLWLKEIVKSSLLINEASHVAVMYSDIFSVFKGTGTKPRVLRLWGAVCFANSEQDFSCMIPIGFKLLQKKKKSGAAAMSELVILLSSCNIEKAR